MKGTIEGKMKHWLHVSYHQNEKMAPLYAKSRQALFERAMNMDFSVQQASSWWGISISQISQILMKCSFTPACPT